MTQTRQKTRCARCPGTGLEIDSQTIRYLPARTGAWPGAVDPFLRRPRMPCTLREGVHCLPLPHRGEWPVHLLQTGGQKVPWH